MEIRKYTFLIQTSTEYEDFHSKTNQPDTVTVNHTDESSSPEPPKEVYRSPPLSSCSSSNGDGGSCDKSDIIKITILEEGSTSTIIPHHRQTRSLDESSGLTASRALPTSNTVSNAKKNVKVMSKKI